ncbi:di-heme-cytochrome C peroxidase [Candidatus Albibeggiatoa sp. nov. NOAA]|uniref:di-heme-cytochrome C peroxidase n=1 Tax=Candidatus Albibeggiatoa sp. nov. NOAA TaxID=3162724 RepID=UPI0032FFDE47|nr:di-heme-cytochrome C peroxidase [Thiotrichaceae bacterium]
MRLTCRRFFLFLLIIAVIIGAFFVYKKLLAVPPYESVDQVIFYDQGWSDEDIQWFYHSTQGTMFPLEYKWFLALEQPIPTFGYPAPPFTEKEFLGGFGFLFDDNINVERLPKESAFQHIASYKAHQGYGENKDPAPYYDEKEEWELANKDGLPVGFAIDKNYVDPLTQEKMTVVGLTCAACHTGQLNYKNVGIRIEGGQSMANFFKFQNALGISMMMTACDPVLMCDPFRFDRFAKKVLGSDYNPDSKAELREKFNKQIAFVKEQVKLDTEHPPLVEEGFGRLDALNRIANFVFGLELYEGNYVSVDAPVTFPYLWGISWFDWVQYNGSVKQPMTRNAGEALGVFASINLKDPTQTLFQSSLDVENLYHFEKLIGGDKPFEGLRAPVWPEKYFGKIDKDKAKKGEALYNKKCVRCHLPPVDSDEICESQYWTEPNDWGLRFIKLPMVNVNLIGTDPEVATDWAKRFIDTKQLGLGVVKGEDGLPFTVEQAVNLKYDALGLTQEQRDEYNGNRKNLVRAPLCYKARPLDGVWATPPFLHNGSVPNLYQLLSPVAERDTKFYVGTREFDPKYVGYKTDPVWNGFELDTSHVGNSNAGHEFRTITAEEELLWPRDEQGNLKYPYAGVLGTKLQEHERWAIIEYLKTLKSRNLNDPRQQNKACPMTYKPELNEMDSLCFEDFPAPASKPEAIAANEAQKAIKAAAEAKAIAALETGIKPVDPNTLKTVEALAKEAEDAAKAANKAVKTAEEIEQQDTQAVIDTQQEAELAEKAAKVAQQAVNSLKSEMKSTNDDLFAHPGSSETSEATVKVPNVTPKLEPTIVIPETIQQNAVNPSSEGGVQ